MSFPEPSRRSLTLSGLLVLLLLATVLGEVHLRLEPYLEDDAYIHLRIARNLATHGAPYFNLDEPVSSSSAPLWTVLLALGLTLGLSGGTAVIVVSTLSTTAAAALATRVVAGEEARPWLTGWGLAGAALSVVVVLPTACQGMETPLVAALLTAGLALARNRRPAALLMLALACAVRVEMIVPFGAIALWALTSWPSRRRALVLALAGLGPLVAYDLAYFGTLIPHAAVAKSKVYVLSLPQVAWRLVTAAVPLPGSVVGRSGLVQGALLVLLTAIVAVALVRRRRLTPPRPVPDLLHVLALASGVAIGGAYLWQRVFIHPWYPPLVLLPVGLGLLGLLRCIGGPTGALTAAAVIATLAVPAVETAAGAVHPEAMPWFRQVARARGYEELGRELARRFPHATLVAAEIGGLGWGFPGPVRDGIGIASPDALRWHPMPIPEQRSRGEVGAIPPGYVEQLHPDLVVAIPGFLGAVLASPVRSDYVRFSAPLFLLEDSRRMASPQLWGTSEIVVLVRRDIVTASGRP